jgi:hypothetical protein
MFLGFVRLRVVLIVSDIPCVSYLLGRKEFLQQSICFEDRNVLQFSEIQHMHIAEIKRQSTPLNNLPDLALVVTSSVHYIDSSIT